MVPTLLPSRLLAALRTAGLAVTNVRIGDVEKKASWTVEPANLQSSAQPVIDAFCPEDPAHDAAELDARVKQALDDERLISAVVWEVIAAVNPPVTKAKYTAARANIISHYKGMPWR